MWKAGLVLVGAAAPVIAALRHRIRRRAVSPSLSPRIVRWWRVACAAAEVPHAAQRHWLHNVVRPLYQERQRHYHTLQHIDDMLALYESHASAIAKHPEVAFSIVFHDVVYNPKASDNEERSVNVFDAFCDAVNTKALRRMQPTVQQFIRATIRHVAPPDACDDLKLFLDMDMAVLGRPWPQYVQYARQVRCEYAHVAFDMYCARRSKFLRGCATQPEALFASQTFHDALVATVRARALLPSLCASVDSPVFAAVRQPLT